MRPHDAQKHCMQAQALHQAEQHATGTATKQHSKTFGKLWAQKATMCGPPKCMQTLADGTAANHRHEQYKQCCQTAATTPDPHAPLTARLSYTKAKGGKQRPKHCRTHDKTGRCTFATTSCHKSLPHQRHMCQQPLTPNYC